MPAYVHVVTFTCKAGTSIAQLDVLVNDALQTLSRIPTVRRLECGRRDVSMNRDVSDTAFHVGLLVICDDKAGYEVYADHPLHAEFIARNMAQWINVRVCDFIAP